MTPLQSLLVAFIGLAIGLVCGGPVGLQESFETGLDKRAICYLDAFGNPYTCDINYWCCVGTEVSGCIPSGYICCDMGSWLGWCRAGSTCSISNGYPVCLGANDNTETIATASTVQTTSPTATKSQEPGPTSTTPASSSGGSLSKGAIIGIAVSVICSILGLIIGVWIRYHFSKKAANKGQIG